MTTIAECLPRPGRFSKFFLAIILAFIAVSFGAALTKALLGAGNVTLKPCATCASCACKPILGGMRCGCPR